MTSAETERAAGVAHVRWVADEVERKAPARGLQESVEVAVFALRVAADDIEAGEHLTNEGK